MIAEMKGFPPLGAGMISPSPMSLRNNQYVSIPPTYFSEGDRSIDAIQKAYAEQGLSGLGDFSLTDLFSGTTGTLLLLGGVAILLIYFFGKDERKAKREDMAKARAKYKAETQAISKKYGKLGLGL